MCNWVTTGGATSIFQANPEQGTDSKSTQGHSIEVKALLFDVGDVLSPSSRANAIFKSIQDAVCYQAGMAKASLDLHGQCI